MKHLLLLFSLLTTAAVYSQKQDYVWLSGYSGYPHPDPLGSTNFFFATSVMNFNHEPVEISMDSLHMYFDDTNTSYCDSNGQLLFYTNGTYIANGLHEKIEGSGTLNDGDYKTAWDTFGYRPVQGIISLPDNHRPDKYMLVHCLYERKDFFGIPHYSKILSTLLDMSANLGHGKVAYINRAIIKDTVEGNIVATQHGNGRDWWIPTPKQGTNCFYRVLVNADGFHVLPELNCGGPVTEVRDFGSAAFSPDGSKYAHFTIYKGLTIFDFDRCNGELTNPVYLPSNIAQDSGWGGSGLAFSPNNRFLYLSATKYLMQYDLWASNISSSVDTIGIYDGYYFFNKTVFASFFHTAQAGPDGKIYISCGNSVPTYHVINSPDLKGDSCDFRQHAIPLPSPSLGVPNFPNYRLGRLTGSACDTLTGLNEIDRTEKEKVLKIFPNPATTTLTIDYGFTDWSKPGEVTIEIVNALGQPVYTQPVPRYSGFQKLDVSHYPTGIYTTYIKRNNAIIATGKFVLRE